MKRIMMIFPLALLLFALSACGNEETLSETSESAPESSVSMEAEQPAEAADTEQEENALKDTTMPSGKTEENMQITNETIVDSEESGGKTLIAYFSLVDIVPEGADASAHATPEIGNTESAALEIQTQVGGDLFAIKTVQTYPVSHSDCSAIAEEEMRSDARPELSTHVENMEDYEIIYIGFPIWWYQEPMAIRTFLEEYDFSGKTIVPFCTTLGAGVEESVDNIKTLCPDATILDGLTLRTGRDSFSESVAEWLEEIGIKTPD